MNFGQSLGFLCLIISLYILWQIHQLLLLIFTAIIFAVALNRLVNFLVKYNFRRYSLSRVQAIGIIVLAFFALIYLFFLLIVPPFVEQFNLLLDLIPRIIDKINEIIISLIFLNQGFTIVPNLSDILDNSQEFTTDLFRKFLQIFSNFFGVALQIIFVFVLTIMFLLNPQLYRQSLLKLFPSFYRNRTQDIFDKTEVAIVSWLNGILINCIFIGTLSGLGLAFLQVKLVLVHALLAGILNFIPNIGPAMSVVFPIMIAILDTPWKIVAILIWYFIIQNIESYWLTPKVMAEKVSLLPAVTLFSQVFFAQSFGLLGLLLALPLTVVAKIWVEEVLFQDLLDQWGKPK